MAFNDFLYSLLNSGQDRHPGIGGGMPETVNRLVAPQAPAPQNALVGAMQGGGAPSPMQQPQQAEPAPQGGGGFLAGLGNLIQDAIDPQARGRNMTIDWLQNQGLDPGTATLLAGNKPALQKYLLDKSQGQGPTEFDQRAAAAQQYGIDVNSPEGRSFILTGKLPDGDKSNLINAGSGNIYDPATGQWITAPNSGQEKLPSSVQEYEYAKKQGFPGTYQDWEASKKGGMSLQVDPETGAVTFQQGGNIKPMTEGQSKDTTFAVRAEGTLPIIDKYGKALTSFPESAAGALPGGVGNYLQSPEYQQAKQAGTEFLQAILRKDTGAAITPQETAEYGKVYLPAPGDSDQVLAQKQLSRKRALEALKAGMTPQAILAQEKALDRIGGAPPAEASGAKAPPQVGETRYGYRFKGGDPSEPSNWEKAQ